MNKEALYRTSAVVFADSNMESRKTETIRRKFVEAVFVEKKNTPLKIQEIGVAVESILGIIITDEEIIRIIDDDKYFIEELGKTKRENKYSLSPERYRHLNERSQDNMDAVVKRYLNTFDHSADNPESIRQLLLRYFYFLMNNNILAYQQILGFPAASKSKIKVEKGDFTDDEIDIINRFLSWKDSTKDKELFKLVSCCIEYAIAVNNSKENALIESFRNKVFYLDNALIYRAIGINGETRKQRTLSFLRKCRESGQELRISKFSYNEFLDTIEYHLNQLNKTTPFGKINPTIFHRYANGEGFYQFYHAWRAERATYSFEIFKNYIITEYNNLRKMYDIHEDYKTPYKEDNDIPEIVRYTEEIKSTKQGRGHQDLHVADARNMYWIECKRNGNDGRMTDTKYYFVTSDMKLHLWDYSHSHNQPLTLLPSQWMALLLKYYSRTNDDYKSFVSFLSIPRDEYSINPEELQDILAGISQTTEDFNNQSLIVETFLETDWRKQREEKASLRQEAKEFAKEKLEEQFAEQVMQKEKEYNEKLSSVQKENNIQVESIKEAYRKELEKVEIQSKRDKLSMVTQQLEDMEYRRNAIQNDVNSSIRKLKGISIIVIIVWIGVIITLGVQSLTIASAIIGILGFFLPAIYCICYEKTFSLERIISSRRKKYEEKYKQKYSFSDSTYSELKELTRQLTDGLNSK